MDLLQLNADLSSIGTVGLLEESNNRLNISIQEVADPTSALGSFNTIIINSVVTEYPTTETIVIEGGSLKAIFSK